MGRILAFILTSTLFLNSYGQIKLDKFERFDCLGGFDVGYEFSKSHTPLYVAGINIFDKKIDGDKLEMFLGVYGNCSDADNAGVRVVADTIEFLYGPIFTENKDIDGNPTYEIEVALCNCCLNFKYSLRGLDPNVNYVLKLTYHVADDYYGTPIDVVNNKERSIYYSREEGIEQSLVKYRNEAIADYKLLFKLYSELTVTLPDDEWSSHTKKINSTWSKFLYSTKAVKDPFVLEKLGARKYSKLIKSFNDQVSQIAPKLLNEYDRLKNEGIWMDWEKEEPIIEEIMIAEDEKNELSSSDVIYTIAELPAKLLMSIDSINQFVNDKIARYGAEIEGIEGEIYFEFIIEKDGSVLEKNVVKGIGTEIDQFVSDRLQELDFSFTPAEIKGVRVKSKTIFPVTIKASSQE